jgi:hypothetical protein
LFDLSTHLLTERCVSGGRGEKMSVIHFKFKNRQDYEKVAISGLEVSGKELKEAIMKKKKIGHSNLEIRDAQTKKGE